jgi:hypothetical protein
MRENIIFKNRFSDLSLNAHLFKENEEDVLTYMHTYRAQKCSWPLASGVVIVSRNS